MTSSSHAAEQGLASQTSLASGVAWSIASFAVNGLSALVISVVIAASAGVAALGRFNVLLAVVLVGGQLGALGMQVAVLYFTPRAHAQNRATWPVLRGGLGVAVLSSTAVTAAFVGAGGIVLAALDSDEYVTSLLLVSPGFWLYPINKTLAAHVNGLGRIPQFTIGLSLRFGAMMIFVILLAIVDVRSELFVLAVSAAELLVTLYLILVLRRELFVPRRVRDGAAPVDRRELVRFGLRGMIGGFLLDVNTRVDVLVLGVLGGATQVGLYSIASIFGEGLYQLAMVVRYSVEPRVADLVSRSQRGELTRLLRRVRNRVYAMIAVVATVSIVLYGPVIGFLYGADVATETRPIYTLLALGVTLASGYIPLTNLLQQAGFPALNSALLAAVSIGNLLANLALVPVLGARGAAIGTIVGNVTLVVGVRTLARRRLGIRV